MSPALSFLPRRAVLGALPALLLGGAAGAVTAPLSELVVVTRAGSVRFAVELVDTPEERAQGLMHRRELAADRGMLFDFKTQQPVTFWMRNTLIPLDMIFIDGDGRIRRIHAQARPLDETPVPSVFPVRAVLEIAGGEAARRGIAVDDTVRHAIFGS